LVFMDISDKVHLDSKNALVIRSIDAHTAGEPLRVITKGIPSLHGKTILEKRKYMRENFDYIRKALMWEPRGHADMYGAILVEPCISNAKIGVLFMHNEGYSTMCGHGIIALVTILFETKVFPVEGVETRLDIETPAGLVTAYANANLQSHRITSVKFNNVPSFVYKQNLKIEIDGSEIVYDIAFGGAFYAYCDVKQFPSLQLNSEGFHNLIEMGKKMKKKVMDTVEIKHPTEPDLSFLYGVIFVGESTIQQRQSDTVYLRNVCVFADGEVDRSPTGTGVSGLLALTHKKDIINHKKPNLSVQSIIGTEFKGKVVQELQYEGMESIIPQVEGKAFITGQNEWIIYEDDELKDGFLLR